jgi:hypothetical protein
VGLKLSHPHADEVRFHVNSCGVATQSGAFMDVRADHQHYDLVVEVHAPGAAPGLNTAVATGSASCK